MPANNIPTVLVIYGATGDLMTKKITPSLYNLFLKGKLPKLFRVIGFARRGLTRQEFQKHISQILESNDTFKIQKRLTEEFLNYFYYHPGQFDKKEDYDTLARELGRIDGEWKACSNKLFYTAVPPQYYEAIFRNLHDSGLTIPCGPEEGWTRVLVEKPFGKDAETAEKLDLLLAKLFKEEQIYRIDHYLAKEMMQNILSFRFANNILEENWNNKFIEQIDIRLLEKLGVEKRGVFYDGLGALRDVGQNHLLQMLAIVTMDHPRNFTADAVRTMRAQVMQHLGRPTLEEIRRSTYRAQYTGYKNIKDVNKNSKTETYFKVRAYLDSSRWRGVPIYLESGKRLKDQIKEIVVTFRHTSPCLCPPGHHLQDKVIFSLEPQERIEIHFLSKKPGLDMQIEKRRLEFTYRKLEAKTQYVEEYEKLLLDCIEGNQILFLSTEEVKEMWRFIDPIVTAWDENKVPLDVYKPDSDEVLQKYEPKLNRKKAQKTMRQEVGIVGLGKMGANAAKQLLEKDWKVAGYNRSPADTQDMERDEGMTGVYDLADFTKALSVPRVIMLSLPAGPAVDDIIFGGERVPTGTKGLVSYLSKGDVIIDAGNSNYKDTLRRAKAIKKTGIHFVDVGFSGGPGGARYGGCLMVGGEKKLFEYIYPLLFDLAVHQGVEFFEGIGAGHFVKMVHNGIEYGMMQSIAEGFDVMKQSKYRLDLERVARIYNHGSVVESRLTNWLENAFRTYGNDLESLSGSAGSGGGGAGARVKGEADWTVDVARASKLPIFVIEDAVQARVKSQKKPSYQGKVINALRNQFGGHKAK